MLSLPLSCPLAPLGGVPDLLLGALGLWGGQATAARPGRRGVGRESGSSATTTTTTLARHDGCDGEGHYPGWLFLLARY
uniref:Expressed protein n=1 Tax=Oryza sativa subsp. japonica TaxID=39947 RepID=H2KW21_ORYSJ|nr:expressed protein [Oryza sativa Japonica Group]